MRSFDHFIGGHSHDLWHREAERLRRLEIDDQLELGRLHDGQIGRLGALENPTDVDAGLTISVGEVGRVAHEAPSTPNSRPKDIPGILLRATNATNSTRR